MNRKVPVRFGAGEKLEITSKAYLWLCGLLGIVFERILNIISSNEKMTNILLGLKIGGTVMNLEVLEERYPDGYFDHYIAMFQSEVNEDGFREHANMYIMIEGLDEFKKLVDEILLIEEKNDWEMFVDLAREYDKEYLNLEKIKSLAKTTVDIWKTENLQK
jgi:hypothetical protein